MMIAYLRNLLQAKMFFLDLEWVFAESYLNLQ